MRSNASILPLFLLLAACGGGAWSDYGVATGASTSAAAQALPAYPRPDADLDRGGYAQPQPGYAQPQPGYAEPQAGYVQPDYPEPAPRYDAPGASYDRPDAGYAQPQPAYGSPASGYVPQAAPYQDPAATASGPAGTSYRSGGEARYDEVGYAGVRAVEGGEGSAAVVAVHSTLPAGTFVEVTSLDTGRTILVLITGSMNGADHSIDLSPGAARQLGANGSTIPVRVRRANAAPPDQMLLRSGQPASERGDTPPVLLNALRKQLPAAPGIASAPAPSDYSRPAPPSRPAAPSGGGYYVQIAALSNAARAQQLAKTFGGFVRAGGGFNRVQMGPFRSAGEAESARQRAIGGGFPDARVFTQN